jgi:hypothetical protein
MFRARPARRAHLFPQRFARAEDAHGGVVCSDLFLIGERLKRRADLHALDRRCVLRFQRCGDASDAAADRAVQLVRRLDRIAQLAREHFQGPISRAVAPLVIDDGV